MLSFKTTFCIILLTGSLTIAPCTAVCDGLNRSASFGHRKQDDQLVSQEQVVASWKFLWYTSREITYPLRGQDQMEITYIEIIDNYSNGHGGCPYIVEGGVGNNFVKIHIQSQFNRGFDFEIKIYGIQPLKE